MPYKDRELGIVKASRCEIPGLSEPKALPVVETEALGSYFREGRGGNLEFIKVHHVHQNDTSSFRRSEEITCGVLDLGQLASRELQYKRLLCPFGQETERMYGEMMGLGYFIFTH